MTLVVEDGNGLPTANSYVDVAYADAYHALRGNVTWAAAATPAKEIALIRATDYIETVFSERFLGSKAFASSGDPAVDQALSFPRDIREAYIGSANYADVQYLFAPNNLLVQTLTKPVTIPVSLKKAQCEYALRALSAALLSDPVVDPTGGFVMMKSQVVGPITETIQYYPTGGIQITQPYPAADLLIRALMRTGGRVVRG